MSQAALGFIGLGQMGRHMASHLAMKSQLPLLVLDKVADACAQFQARHSQLPVSVATSPREIGQKASCIVTMLPSSPHVQHVYLDPEEGVLAGLCMRSPNAPAPLLIDSSTIDPATSQRVTDAILKQVPGCRMVDAPVSGGILGAEAGTLTFMVGSCTESHFDVAKPFLAMMGKHIVHCGTSGMGQVAKICNNMLLGISMIATAEAMNLGIRCGMDPKKLADIMASSSGRNWSLDTYNPVPGILPMVPASHDYQGGFGIELMLKDMGLASDAAAHSNSTVMLGNLAKEIFRVVSESTVTTKDGKLQALKGKDFSCVFKWLNDNATKF